MALIKRRVHARLQVRVHNYLDIDHIFGDIYECWYGQPSRPGSCARKSDRFSSRYDFVLLTPNNTDFAHHR